MFCALTICPKANSIIAIMMICFDIVIIIQKGAYGKVNVPIAGTACTVILWLSEPPDVNVAT